MPAGQDKPIFEVQGPGLVVARFASNEQATVENMPDLAVLVRAQSQVGDVGLLVLTEDGLRMVDFRVPVYWAEQFRDPAMRVRALAVVTRRRAVLAVVNGFAKTLGLLGISTKVRAFDGEAEARQFLVTDAGVPRAA